MMDDLERQLLEAERSEPPAGMRTRVLAAAAPCVRADGSWLDRLWFSPGWRLTAALLFLVLIGADAMSNNLDAPGPYVRDHLAESPARAAELVAAQVGLTPADAAIIAARASRIAASPVPGPGAPIF